MSDEMSSPRDLRYGFTVAGLTPTPLTPPLNVAAYQGILLLASPDNTRRVWLGGSQVRTSGHIAEGLPMLPGVSLALPSLASTDGLYITSDDIGQRVHWMLL